jgi:tetratricopeptide (TPR) repeat protein
MKFNLKTLLFLIIALCAFALGMKQLREPDIWWQLLSGRWMIEHGAITHSDVFSYTMTGKPWINVKWLYEILIATLEKGLGPESVLLLQAIVNVVIIGLLYKTLNAFSKYHNKSYSTFSTAIAILLFLAVDEYRMAGRPEMISHLMCTLFLYILWRNPAMEWKKIWWLIPLQCLWANMHEGYPVGIVIIGATVAGGVISYLLNREKSTLQFASRSAILLTVCILVILLNPNGIVLWKQPFEIYRQVWANKYTTELYSYQDAQYWTIQAKWHITILILVIAYWTVQLITAFRNKQLKQFFSPLVTVYLLLIVLFAYLSLTANRNIPFAQIVLLPTVPIALVWLWQKFKLSSIGILKTIEKQAILIALFISVVFYGCIVSNKYYQYTSSPNKYGIHVSMLHNPTGAADFIKQHKLQGPVFSDYFVSSYLLWQCYPQFKSYIDLRDLDVFPVSFFDDYFKLYELPEKFDEINNKYGFNYIVISTSQLQSLQMKLYWGEGYNLIYVDPVAAIFLKQNDANAGLNNNTNLQKMYNWPATIDDPRWAWGLTKLMNPTTSYNDEDESRQAIHAARFYSMIKNFDAAIKQLLPQIGNFSDDAEVNAALGSTYLQYADVMKVPEDKNRKLDSASIYLEQAQNIDPDNEATLSALGTLNMTRGDYKTAAEYYEKYLNKNKTDDYGVFVFGYCNYQLLKNTGDNSYAKKTIKAMQNSMRLNPQNGKGNLYIADCYLALDDKDEARKYLKASIASGNHWLKEEQNLLDVLKVQLGVK